jgi:hypothetical protein
MTKELLNHIQRAQNDMTKIETSNFKPLSSPLYHRAELLYSRGDLILAGNFAKRVFGLGVPADTFLFFQEYVLEMVRKWEFCEKPSRLKSAFVFDNCDLASNWSRSGTDNQNAPKEYVYLVKLTDPNCKYHRGDLTWLKELLKKINTFDAMNELARQYWRSEQRELDRWEIVVDSDLIVEDRITPIPENGFMSHPASDQK